MENIGPIMKRFNVHKQAILALSIAMVLTACNQEKDHQQTKEKLAPVHTLTQAKIDSKSINFNPTRDAFFGETHVHTAYSLDAYLGGTRLTHDQAYSYAQGGTVTLAGQQLTRRRPLDFVAISDHAEYIGEMYSALNEGALGYDDPLLLELRTLTDLNERRKWFVKYVVSSARSTTPTHPPFFAGAETVKSAWQLMSEAADRNNKPGVFTALKAFEWSAGAGGANLHRNVIFRDDKVPESVISYVDVQREDDLWQWMAEQEAAGMQLFAIPHNSNASKGMMFPDVQADGSPIDLEYAQLRQHFEPLIEMMQTKGNSEVHRKFWAQDEFSDFENADSIQNSSERTFLKRNFVREGLKIGLAFERKLGVNPFKYGTIGGTDDHNGLPSPVAEDSYIGSHGDEDNTVLARRESNISSWIDGKDLSIGSLAGVWATQNTREGIWDAMKQRETFTTSGPRIKVRFFGGTELPAAPKNAHELVTQGYAFGVPMGSDLNLSISSGSENKAPTFTVHAMKDPQGANLDRIQIIKGWVSNEGELKEDIIDVVWSDNRTKDENGKLTAVGNTVDLTTAQYKNTIGATELISSWRDKNFNAEQHAFYYARVIEIPTPRWTTYDAVRSKMPLLKDVPAIIQERAWTSPIWSRPNAKTVEQK